jgi:hypothetical protein
MREMRDVRTTGEVGRRQTCKGQFPLCNANFLTEVFSYYKAYLRVERTSQSLLPETEM